MNGLNLSIDRRLERKNQDFVELRSFSSGTPRAIRREYIAPDVLLAIRKLARPEAGVWGPRGRFRIYPALSQREWGWLRNWAAFADGREAKSDWFFYYQAPNDDVEEGG
jgi:hypothetical protein